MASIKPGHYSERTLSIALVISAAVWGLYWIPLRSIEATGLSGAWSVVLFNACPLLVLLPVLLFKLRSIRGIIGPTLIAALLIGSAFTFFGNGLVETTVIRATMLYYLTPVWSTLVGVLWLSEFLTKARIIAIFVALIGLYLLLSGGGLTGQPINIGDLYSLLAGIFWAFSLAALKRWPGIPTTPLTALIFIVTTLLSILFALAPGNISVPEVNMIVSALPTAMFWSIIILLPTFFVIFEISKKLFPGRVAILTMSEVMVAVISASILLPGESMIWVQWVGALAIVAAGLIEVGFGYVALQRVSEHNDTE